MMKCKNCDNEAVGRSKYCSDSCKTVWNRNKPADETVTENRNNETVTPTVTPTVTQPAPSKFAKHVTMDDQPDCTKLPPNVTHPTGQRTGETRRLTASQLRHKVSTYHGQAWIDSPEYAEVIYRLLTLTPEQLDEQGQDIPAWKRAEQAA